MYITDFNFDFFDDEDNIPTFGDDLFDAKESVEDIDDFDFDIDDAFESIATNLRRDFTKDPNEPLSLKSMYRVFMNADAIKKYEKEYSQLKEVDKHAEYLRGHMYFLDGKLTCFISIKPGVDKTWIDTLHVVKEYRGRKLSHQLLDVAVRKFHATDLKVHKDNERAISIFKTYGFKTYDKKNQWLYMSIKSDVKSIDDIHTTENKPVERDVRTDKMKTAGAPEAGKIREKEAAKESVLALAQEGLFSTKQMTVDELLEKVKPTLQRKLKTVEDCDDYLEVIKNESIKFNEAINGLISAKAKYDKSKKTPADKKIFRETTNAAMKLLHKNCSALNVRLNAILPGDTKEVSREDIKRVSQYIQGLRKIVNEIKRDLKSSAKKG